MPYYQVNFITDATYNVWAEDEEEAYDEAYDLLMSYGMGEFDWDCNEIVELDEEDVSQI